MKTVFGAIIFSLAASVAVANPTATSIINDYRDDKRRTPLAYSATLEQVAKNHAGDMATKGYFSHTGANGSSVGDRVRGQNYQWCFVAENIAKGQKDLAQVMAGWKSSKGHYKNMMHKKAREFGLARGAGNTWVMVLAAPC
jgi:uncharacterized protein YkwD